MRLIVVSMFESKMYVNPLIIWLASRHGRDLFLLKIQFMMGATEEMLRNANPIFRVELINDWNLVTLSCT